MLMSRNRQDLNQSWLLKMALKILADLDPASSAPATG
jgi:hypothetical protein